MMHKLTESMKLFEAGITDFYVSNDAFKHQLQHPRMSHGLNRMTTTCLICHKNRTDPYSETQTPDNEMIAVEVAHWQMDHREKCRVPLGAIKL